MTLNFLRPRVSSEPVAVSPSDRIVGGARRIMQGLFGVAAPPSATANAQVRSAGFYTFHEGDVFTPGPANFALDPPYETPINTNWGHGVLYARSKQIIPDGPVLVQLQQVATNGLGGVRTGQLVNQPLMDPTILGD